MSLLNWGNAIFVLGLILSAFFFSRGVQSVGTVFVFIMIAGLLMNPHECKEEVIQ